jgi:hypothetical protein
MVYCIKYVLVKEWINRIETQDRNNIHIECIFIYIVNLSMSIEIVKAAPTITSNFFKRTKIDSIRIGVFWQLNLVHVWFISYATWVILEQSINIE